MANGTPPNFPGPKPLAPPGLLSNIARPGIKPPVPGLISGGGPNIGAKELAAIRVGADKKVPPQFIIDFMNMVGKFESNDDPNKIQDVWRNGVLLEGKGRGVLQFEGKGTEGTSLKTAANRAEDYHTKPGTGRGKRNGSSDDVYVLPNWLNNIKETDDARSLTKDQQYALGIYNFKMMPGANFKTLYDNRNDPDALFNFYAKYHWTGGETAKKAQLRADYKLRWDNMFPSNQ
tara:strand:- start:1069 stop:1764 length:696 start_codon:yes stop_codon:yes gene_type:complete